MLLTVDIGNTNIHVGVFEGDKLENYFSLGSDKSRSGDEYAHTLKSHIEELGYNLSSFNDAIIGSVLPQLTSKIEYAISKITNLSPILVGKGTKTGYHIKLDDPTEPGADLVSNTAGALELVGAPAIIVDFGTATTVSCINKDKSYVGCYIMPGIQMSLDSLNGTGLLPSVIADKDFPLVGKNSQDSMRSGVSMGAILAVEGFINTFKCKYDLPENTTVIVTGGFADYLLPHFNCKVKHLPNLTLKGLNAIYHKSITRK